MVEHPQKPLSAPKVKNYLIDWKNEKDIQIIHKELISWRSRMLFFYRSVISITTDEPALYIYSLKSGHLKERYDLHDCKFKVKGKKKFKFSSKGKTKYNKISNTFKIKEIKKNHRDSTNKIGIIDLLKNTYKK